jgi:hypothetical protein
MFEFEYKLDKDDLSYIWQNLAPRDYKKIAFEESSVAHELIDTELLSADNILNNPNLRWMVFKVKQRSKVKYSDLKVPQVGSYSNLLNQLSLTANFGAGATLSFGQSFPIQFNWPYDFVSFVELIKMDAEVLYSNPPPAEETTTTTTTTAQETARNAAIRLPSNRVAASTTPTLPRVGTSRQTREPFPE